MLFWLTIKVMGMGESKTELNACYYCGDDTKKLFHLVGCKCKLKLCSDCFDMYCDDAVTDGTCLFYCPLCDNKIKSYKNARDIVDDKRSGNS